MPSILTRDMVAERCLVCTRTVDNWIKSGLRHAKIGRLVRIREDDLEAFLSPQGCEQGTV